MKTETNKRTEIVHFHLFVYRLFFMCFCPAIQDKLKGLTKSIFLFCFRKSSCCPAFYLITATGNNLMDFAHKQRESLPEQGPSLQSIMWKEWDGSFSSFTSFSSFKCCFHGSTGSTVCMVPLVRSCSPTKCRFDIYLWGLFLSPYFIQLLF